MKILKGLQVERNQAEEVMMGYLEELGYDELEATEQELSQLQQLKKGLMQDLLSGTVRVKI
jgi:hypothetical protein